MIKRLTCLIAVIASMALLCTAAAAQGTPPPPPPPPPGYTGPAPATGIVTEPAAGAPATPAEETGPAAEDIPDDTVIARVGEETLTWGEFLDQLHRMPPQYRMGLSKDKRLELVDSWIDGQLMHREALRRGLDQRPDVAERLEEMRKQVLAHYLRTDLMEADVEVTPEDVAEYYDQHIDTYVVPEQVKMRHVMITQAAKGAEGESPEDLIRAAAEELANGTDFAQVARERSEDNASKMRGGDVGFIDRRRCNALYGAEVEKAAFALEKGEVSEPVKGTRGWHIVRIDAKQPARQRELEDVSISIESTLRRKKQEEQYRDTVNKLRREANVTIDKSLIGKASPELRRDRPAPPPAEPPH